MSEHSKEQPLEKCYIELLGINSGLDDTENSLDIPGVLQFIQKINELDKTLSKIRVEETDPDYTRLLYAEALMYISSLKEKAELVANKILDATPVKDTQEGIIGEMEAYYPGLDFAQAKDDGNCFYYSIAAALNADNKENEPRFSQQKLRTQVADFYQQSSEEQKSLKPILIVRKKEKIAKEIEDTQETILAINSMDDVAEKQQILATLEEQLQVLQQKQSSSTTITTREIKKHIDKIRSNEWADEIAIAALSKILNRPIVVVEGSKNSLKIKPPIHGEKQQGDPIFVHYNGTNHYNALIVQPNHTGRKILQQLVDITDHSAKRPRHN